MPNAVRPITKNVRNRSKTPTTAAEAGSDAGGGGEAIRSPSIFGITPRFPSADE